MMYELCFIRADGRRLRGPIVKKSEVDQYVQFLDGLNDQTSTLNISFGNRRFFVPTDAFRGGHVETRRVSRLYSWVRAWRCR